MNARLLALILAIPLVSGSSLKARPRDKVSQGLGPLMQRGEVMSEPSTQQSFELKRKAFPRGDLFRIFKTAQMSQEERDLMTFLYAYMPANDLVDRSGEYFLEHVRLALEARREMPWGRRVPEREFRHFVLPPRVNNEDLDSARRVFYHELRDRVRGLSLYDAVLEVNHWCHEHVVYTPSDARTSSPLATIRSAYGRCGEESTLLVSALRSVGIPARQVYTPRWAHTDDNHAWVEAWVDGRWMFLGACEPEPVLNLGWFNAPVSRAMLVHTKAFGYYTGPEEVMSRTANYTEINVIRNYAEASTMEVKVVDEGGRPMAGVEVEFKLYNYGEFYSIARLVSDLKGRVQLTAGHGDVLLWASATRGSRAAKQGSQAQQLYALRQVRFGRDTQVELRLDKMLGKDPIAAQLIITPPRERAVYPEVTPEMRAENDRRMRQEDSIRNAYVATFLTEQMPGLDARGNWRTLRRFVEGAADPEQAKALLGVISAKDRRDVPLEVLTDHLVHTRVNKLLAAEHSTLVMPYVYNPRVANELLTPYKQALRQAVKQAGLEERLSRSPEEIYRWCLEHLHIDDTHNALLYATSPTGVWRSRVADRHSAAIFFVALARTMGWAARIDEVTGRAQYFSADRWVSVPLGKAECIRKSSVSGRLQRYQAGSWVDLPKAGEGAERNPEQGMLRLGYTSNGIIDNPKYYHQFTLSRLTDAGRWHLLSYDTDDKGLEQGATWSGVFAPGTSVDAGQYILTSGSRLANGSVLVDMKSFWVKPQEHKTIELVMRRDTAQVAVLGSFNSESLYEYLGSATSLMSAESLARAQGVDRSLLSTTGRGYYVLGILGAGGEPTNHALRDIAAVKEDLERWGRSLVLVFADEAGRKRFRPEEFPGLPSTAVYGVDRSGELLRSLREEMKLPSGNLPVFIIADTFNRIVFVSQGYTIGLGAQLRRVIAALEEK